MHKCIYIYAHTHTNSCICCHYTFRRQFSTENTYRRAQTHSFPRLGDNSRSSTHARTQRSLTPLAHANTRVLAVTRPRTKQQAALSIPSPPNPAPPVHPPPSSPPPTDKVPPRPLVRTTSFATPRVISSASSISVFPTLRDPRAPRSRSQTPRTAPPSVDVVG